MDMSRILKFILIIETLILLCNVVTISRDYQDSWILEGLELPFTVLMITYLVYFSIEKNISWLIIFGLIIRFTILLVPNLKYQFFQGFYIDQHFDYRFVQDIYIQGSIITGYEDTGTPSMHLLFVIYSFITGLDIVNSLKFFPILPWLIFPIITYLLMKIIDTKNYSAQKYALLISSIPVKPSISYFVMGTLFGPLIVFLILYELVKKYQQNNYPNIITLIIYSFVLASMHSFSSIAFIILLGIMFFMVQLFKSKQVFIKHLLSSLMIITFINLAWYSYISTTFIMSLKLLSIHIGKTIGIFKKPGIEGFFYIRFFEIGFLDQFKVILVYHGADIFLIILTIIGFWIIYKKNWMQEKLSLMLFSLYLASLMLFFTFGYIFNIGLQWYDRTIRLFLVSSPIFAGISLQHFEAKTRNKLVPTFIIGMFLVVSTVQLYLCQPLIPSASSFSKELPDDEPLVYVNTVNTVYQRDMISYAERFFPYGKSIASDKATKNQIFGLTSMSFSRAHLKYYPLSKEEPLKFDYFLIHIPGKSGGFEEKAEMRTMSLILSSIYNSSYNIIYTNSESYVLSTR